MGEKQEQALFRQTRKTKLSHGPKNSVSLNKAATKNLPKGRHEERQTRNTKDIMKRTDEESREIKD